jgi:hypothetical protein
LVPVKMEGVIIVRSKLLFDSSDLLVGIWWIYEFGFG